MVRTKYYAFKRGNFFQKQFFVCEPYIYLYCIQSTSLHLTIIHQKVKIFWPTTQVYICCYFSSILHKGTKQGLFGPKRNVNSSFKQFQGRAFCQKLHFSIFYTFYQVSISSKNKSPATVDKTQYIQPWEVCQSAHSYSEHQK